MLKEQVINILTGAVTTNMSYPKGLTWNQCFEEIDKAYKAWFKAEVDKLTVIDDEERQKISNDVAYRSKSLPDRTSGQSYVYRLMKAQLQHTKKQLSDLWEK